jgi:hypothetical protein
MPEDKIYARVVGTHEVMCIERKYRLAFNVRLEEITEIEWLRATDGMVPFLQKLLDKARRKR